MFLDIGSAVHGNCCFTAQQPWRLGVRVPVRAEARRRVKRHPLFAGSLFCLGLTHSTCSNVTQKEPIFNYRDVLY